MSTEPPSTSAESRRLGIRKKIKKEIRRIYKYFSYKPQNKQEVAGSIRESNERGVLEKGTLNMMEGALKVSTAHVRDIMIPRSQMVYVGTSEKPQDFLSRIIESHHSRFPVINKSSEQVEGILLAKDLLDFNSTDDFKLTSIMRPPVLIPEGKKLNVLLDELRINRNHMAIVLDEYGGIAGLVTIEDVLEEIVGEIEDEYDIEQDNYIKQLTDKEYLVSGLTPIEEFNEKFDTSFSDKELDTLGGIVLQNFSRFPKLNDSIVIEDMRFVISSLENKRISSVKVSRTS